MRLTVLGGSSASPNAGMGCSGYLVEAGPTTVVLDFGPGILPELRRHTDFRRLDAIVISHMDVDHVLDLLALRHALAYNPTPAPGPVPIWLPPGGASLLARAVAPFDRSDTPGTFDRTVFVTEYDPNQSLDLPGLRITFAPTVHDVPGYAMRLTDHRSRSIGYTGDTGPAANLAGFFRNVDLLIAESTLIEPGPRAWATRGSLTAAEAGDLARQAAASRLLLTHIWQETGFATCQDQAATTYPGPVALASPGLQIAV